MICGNGTGPSAPVDFSSVFAMLGHTIPILSTPYIFLFSLVIGRSYFMLMPPRHATSYTTSRLFPSVSFPRFLPLSSLSSAQLSSPHPYIPSHSSSSPSPSPSCPSLAIFLSSSSLSLFLFRSLSAKSTRSNGQVPFSSSQGRMHSRSKMWELWQGSCTRRGYGSAAKGWEQMGQVGASASASASVSEEVEEVLVFLAAARRGDLRGMRGREEM